MGWQGSLSIAKALQKTSGTYFCATQLYSCIALCPT